MRRIALLTVTLMMALLTAPPALAVSPPSIDPGAVPPDVVGPDQPLEQRSVCRAPLTTAGTNFNETPWANTYLGIDAAHRFATGAGVTVAVIDTGIDVSPRVLAEPGGDFVIEGDGLTDCDAHGTLTAAIIGGRPSLTDDFVGVAPDVRLISVRQTSEAFEPKDNQNQNQNDPNASPAAGSIRSLARAVVHAANLGAGVINISEAACFNVKKPVDESTLGAALNYAVNVKGAVVVVAAGNTGGDCKQNPPPDPAQASDKLGWTGVQTIVTPAWYAPLVLSVGGVGPNGAPSQFSMHGPWVGVAAPAEKIIALGTEGEPVDALPAKDGPVPIAGTSFAAAYVSGLAALVRQKYPKLTPQQVVERITATARHPGGGVNDVVGAGVINAVAALTWDVPANTPSNPVVERLQIPKPPPPPDHGPITVVVLGSLGFFLALGLVALTARALRRR